MEIWETDAAILGGDGELVLQEDGWEPCGMAYVPISDLGPGLSGALRRKYPGGGYFEVLYRRKREGLKEKVL